MTLETFYKNKDPKNIYDPYNDAIKQLAQAKPYGYPLYNKMLSIMGNGYI